MKQLFTYLLAVLALLTVSQKMVAEDVYLLTSQTLNGVTGDYNNPPSSHKMEWESGDTYKLKITSCSSPTFNFRIQVNGWGDNEFYPASYTNNTPLGITEEGNATSALSAWQSKGLNATWLVTYNSADYEYITVHITIRDNGTDTRKVWIDSKKKGSSGESKKSFYLIGGPYNGWVDDYTRQFTTTDGKVYTYTFPASTTGDYYFRVRGKNEDGSDFKDIMLPKSLESASAGNYEITTSYTSVGYAAYSTNASWQLAGMTSDNTYTVTLDYSNASVPQIKYTATPVATTDFKISVAGGLVKEETNKSGVFSCDLTDATDDAVVTFSIDGATWGLETAATASTSTTTSYTFINGGIAALTLPKGYKYSLRMTAGGLLSVTPYQQGSEEDNVYYLVGNFFNDDTAINYDRKYFRFTDNGDGTLSLNIPSTLTVNAQLMSSNGNLFGPLGSGYGVSASNPSSATTAITGDLTTATNAPSNYWAFTSRTLSGDGIYKITINLNGTTPETWKIEFDPTQRMAYFLPDPNETPDAVAYPAYSLKKSDGGTDNKFFGNVYLNQGQHCYVVGNIKKDADSNNHALTMVADKLYMQGNGGGDPTTGKSEDTKVFPNRKTGFAFTKTKSVTLEYNPSQGESEIVDEKGNDGIGGEVMRAQGDPGIEVEKLQIVGNGVTGENSWDLSTAKDMTYNADLGCWEITIQTTADESTDNLFRFVANDDWATNWGEESTEPSKQARVPYLGTGEGVAATVADPNDVDLEKAGTIDARGAKGDIIFNRPAGTWMIRFWTETISTGNFFNYHYYYTITGSKNIPVPLTYRVDKFIRTYSNDKAMVAVTPGTKIYEVYKYQNPDDVEDIYTQSKVYLRQLDYIPANVGVVLIGEAPAGKTYNDGDKLNFTLRERTDESATTPEEYVNVWTKASQYTSDSWNNYLEPTITGKQVGNVEFDESGNVAYRLFGLGNYHRTRYYASTQTGDDYIGFFRLTKTGKSGDNKAYLRVPANATVGNGVGATYGYIDYDGQFIDDETDDSSVASLAKVALVFDDEERGDPTGIKEIEDASAKADGKFYNLQGIQVAKPVKGIYIHNGKKVIVK